MDICEDEEQCGGGMATSAGLLGFMLLQSDASGEESTQTTVPGQKALKHKEDSKTPFGQHAFHILSPLLMAD